jgi:HD-GYP domain-containing protein (c-di-GMP phosphodiesterase class II)
MEADRQVYGILCFSGKPGSDFFPSTEVKLASAVAAYTASILSNARLYENVRSLFLGAIAALSNAIESKDEYTRGHVERVTRYAAAIAEKMGFEAERVELIRISAMMHDLGKIGVPDQILQKEGILTDQERAVMQRHALVGPRILEGIRNLEPLVPWIRGHHERPDGTGYPYGLRGAEIPIEAQIIAVADAFDAMTSDRSYRKAVSPEEAARRLLEGVGRQFSAEVVQAFLQTPECRKLIEGQT